MGGMRPRTAIDRHQESVDRFIDFWGDMASNWGINRTMAQIHAFLYAQEDPADTDTIMQRLDISRGNASMNLRSLMKWNLVSRVHLEGSRKDYYTAKKDVWEIMAQIVQVRKQREVRPILNELERCRSELTDGRSADELSPHELSFLERIDRLIELMQIFEGFTETIIPLIQQRNAPIIRQIMNFAREKRGIAETKNVHRQNR